MENIVGKYILDTWINGKYVTRWLRRINRETKTQYVSDVLRYNKNWDDDIDDMYYVGRWAKRYAKTPNGFKYIATNRSSPDGKSHLTLVDKLGDVKCVETFEKLFQTDVRTFMSDNSEDESGVIFDIKLRYKENIKDEHFKLERYIRKATSKDDTYWNSTIIKFLEDEFNLPIFRFRLHLCEHENNLVLKTATHFHITHFGDDAKVVDRKVNYANKTILFWLFDDKVVFTYQDGIGTW